MADTAAKEPKSDSSFLPTKDEKVEHTHSEFDDEDVGRRTSTFSLQLPQYQPPKPSIPLLFSFCSRRDILFVFVPSTIISIIAGGVAPFMTLVLGQGFDAFSTYASNTLSHGSVTKHDTDTLLHGVGIAAAELLALAVGAVALSSLMSSMWILVGERNVLGLRKYVYSLVNSKEMEWFDINMRSDQSSNDDSTATSGAAGLMAKFAKETDEVRSASSLTLGIIIQNFVTVLAALALAFRGSWSLTLVIFSTIPLIMIIQSFAQSRSTPLLTVERNVLAQCADHCDRSFSSIATVKAFNAEDRELDQLEYFLEFLQKHQIKLYITWGFTTALSQFVVMSTFVTGFWFGSFLVRTGHSTPGGVMGVFWACLIATNNLQLVLPHFVTLSRGMAAMVSLRTLIEAPIPPRPELPPPDTMNYDDVPRSSKMVALPNLPQSSFRKIVPDQPAKGEFMLQNVTFAYPTRPLQPVLKDVSIFLPPNETTFIVGASGSGKSTIAALLTRLYTPQYGSITMDDQELSHLAVEWTRSHIFHVSQTCVLFPGTIAHNVAMGLAGSPYRQPGEESRAEVIAACRASLLHEFIRDELPDGYDTEIGNTGDLLSGGQKQRLAIARARLRDPTVLILDECTSALDPTSRTLVFSALKAWRRNRTTIVITHDLSQIEKDDFVYVMKVGSVVEQGYRLDLSPNGEFGRMARVGGNEDEGSETEGDDLSVILEEDAESHHRIDVWTENNASLAVNGFIGGRSSHQSGTWGFGIPVAGDEGGASAIITPIQPNRRTSALPPQGSTTSGFRQANTLALAIPYPVPVYSQNSRVADQPLRSPIAPPSTMMRYSIPAPSSPPLSHLAAQYLAEQQADLRQSSHLSTDPTLNDLDYDMRGATSDHFPTITEDQYDENDIIVDDDQDFQEEKQALEKMAAAAASHRGARPASDSTTKNEPLRKSIRIHHSQISQDPKATDNSSKSSQPKKKRSKQLKPSKKTEDTEPPTPLGQVLWRVYKSIPHKPLLAFGIVCCLVTGAVTPIFSFLLSRLLFEISIGAKDKSITNLYGGIIFATAFADGLFNGLKYLIMESCAVLWIHSLRKTIYLRVLKQDKKWFDRSENKSEGLVHVLFKDGEDAKLLIGRILGQTFLVAAMLGLGLIWALILGWQLTLAGFAIAPIFAGVMGIQATLVNKFQKRNKQCHEAVAKGYHEALSNIRSIRSMAFEDHFRRQFDQSLQEALRCGVRGAFVEGCNVGIASGLIYFAEALLFWVGAVLVANQTYTYLQMVQVLQLVVFSVSIASQLLAFTGSIAKAIHGTRDLDRLLTLSEETDESLGKLQPEIQGSITFKNVTFAYPERPTAPVLKGVDLHIKAGECIAIVGGSGSGKSTVASLLQRLYPPTSGTIAMDGTSLSATDVTWLRDHVSIVTQKPELFDMTVIDNIAYGSRPLTDEACYAAAQACNADEFILDLPEGYETQLGNKAEFLSGGQAQRIAIARALVRGAKVLILDECTSALDAENQAFVMDSIYRIREGRTIIMITHKVPLMRMCDRILVMNDGVIAEEGTYDSLMQRRGVFSQLASGGEWAAE